MQCSMLFVVWLIMIKNHNPRKGTETTWFEILLVHKSFLIKNHNPRKGTETNQSLSAFQLRQFSVIKNHNPRKGTETIKNQVEMEMIKLQS